jgi:L-lactate dehydrogenase complex protein LldG
MSSAATRRDSILGALRQRLGRRDGDGGPETVAARIVAPARGPIPARATGDHADRVALFVEMAEEVAANVVRVPSAAAVPDAVADYLKSENLPAEVRLAPEPELKGLPWDSQPLISLSEGPARPTDPVSLTGAFAGIAETGTLMLASGPSGPTTLNFLPETHMVVLEARNIAGCYEDAWDRLRAARTQDGGMLPRTVNLITGPSRTADIEQTIQLGAHGPRRLCILLVDDSLADDPLVDDGEA